MAEAVGDFLSERLRPFLHFPILFSVTLNGNKHA